MKFNVGDRVVGNEYAKIYIITGPGWTGEVVGVAPPHIIVKGKGLFGNPVSFEVEPHRFDKVRRNSDRKIVVTVDGETTTARLYNGKVLEKSAEAKCSPDDRFDFNVGAGLAIDRLLDREAPKSDLFPRDELKPGRFGRMIDGQWFVVLGDRMLYMNGSEGWDRIGDLDGDGWFPTPDSKEYTRRGVDIIVGAVSLKDAKRTASRGGFIWCRVHK